MNFALIEATDGTMYAANSGRMRRKGQMDVTHWRSACELRVILNFVLHLVIFYWLELRAQSQLKAVIQR